MVPTTFSLQAASQTLEDEGLVDLEDSSIGGHILDMEKRRFPFSTEYGLDFCNTHVLQNERVRSIVKSTFRRCVLAHWLRYEAYPGHIVSFMRGGQRAGRCALVIHLWAKGSRVNYFPRSHMLELPATKGKRLLWETAPSAISEAGCMATEKYFEDGGLVILDARTNYEIKQGYAIKFEFVTEDLIKSWPKMVLPKSGVLERKVDSMQSAEIGVNFAFKDHLATEPK
uniref:Uncharacterized protein n=1 Tax=Photinus pyralis TaxID=7054 RepID=A0A1Y1LJC5_PHOPY